MVLYELLGVRIKIGDAGLVGQNGWGGAGVWKRWSVGADIQFFSESVWGRDRIWNGIDLHLANEKKSLSSILFNIASMKLFWGGRFWTTICKKDLRLFWKSGQIHLPCERLSFGCIEKLFRTQNLNYGFLLPAFPMLNRLSSDDGGHYPRNRSWMWAIFAISWISCDCEIFVKHPVGLHSNFASQSISRFYKSHLTPTVVSRIMSVEKWVHEAVLWRVKKWILRAPKTVSFSNHFRHKISLNILISMLSNTQF